VRELIACWQNTRLVVLIGLCAALFVAVLIPFKLLSIIPGITEIRPAMALPIVFSIFFGPAAAWAAAFGNLIADFFGGTISPGSIFGFIGNFVYAYVPYRLLKASGAGPQDNVLRTRPVILFYSIVLACALCAVIIALGVQLIGIPFVFLSHTIFVNNIVVSIILVPLLYTLLRKRVQQLKLTYQQILSADQISASRFGIVGSFVLLIAIAAAYLLMIFPSFGLATSKTFALIASLILPLLALFLV